MGSPHYLYGAPLTNQWLNYIFHFWLICFHNNLKVFVNDTSLKGNNRECRWRSPQHVMWTTHPQHISQHVNTTSELFSATTHLKEFRRRHIWTTREQHIHNMLSGKNANLIWFYFKTTNLFLRKKYILFIILSIVFTEYKSSCNVARIESVSSINCNACFC